MDDSDAGVSEGDALSDAPDFPKQQGSEDEQALAPQRKKKQVCQIIRSKLLRLSLHSSMEDEQALAPQRKKKQMFFYALLRLS